MSARFHHLVRGMNTNQSDGRPSDFSVTVLKKQAKPYN